MLKKLKNKLREFLALATRTFNLLKALLELEFLILLIFLIYFFKNKKLFMNNKRKNLIETLIIIKQILIIIILAFELLKVASPFFS